MLSCEPRTLRGYKRMIDDGYAGSFGDGMRMESRRSIEHMAGVSPESVAQRRASIQIAGPHAAARAAMITLYGPAHTPFTEKVRRALLYKGLEFELVEPTRGEDYKRWSPKTGQLPVLDLHGEHVPDSTDILVRLDQAYPEPPLLSPDPTVAAQQRQLEEWADESFLYYFMKLPAHGDGRQLSRCRCRWPARAPSRRSRRRSRRA